MPRKQFGTGTLRALCSVAASGQAEWSSMMTHFVRNACCDGESMLIPRQPKSRGLRGRLMSSDLCQGPPSPSWALRPPRIPAPPHRQPPQRLTREAKVFVTFAIFNDLGSQLYATADKHNVLHKLMRPEMFTFSSGYTMFCLVNYLST